MFKRTEKFLNYNHLNHPEVNDAMIEDVLRDPEFVDTQDDGRIRYWGQADPFNDGKLWYLRVVTLEDGETVLTAFIDGKLSDHMRSDQK